MQVILLEQIRNVGNIGEKVNVKAGFGRNFLIPQNKALPATAANLAEFESRRAEFEALQAEKLTVAKARSEAVLKLKIEIETEADQTGKLYGSISPRAIAEAVTQAGVEIDKSEVKLPEGPLKQVGEYSIDLQLHSEITAPVAINVTAKAAFDE